METGIYTEKAIKRMEQLNDYIDYLKALPQTTLVLAQINNAYEDLAWISEAGFATEEEAKEFYNEKIKENK